ncbi:MAG: hypothetical protein P4M14_04340 [Gammaproteobacteria bacterium]|nr:hypothetical protein [Gammaproteobacteria bacterium]
MAKSIETTIAEMLQTGAPLTGDLENILLRDPQSLKSKEFQAALSQFIENEIDLDELAHLITAEKQHEEDLEDTEREEAYLAKYERERQQASPFDYEKIPQSPTPNDTNTIEPSLSILLIEFLRYNHALNNTRQATHHLHINQQALRQQWQANQAANANHFVNQLHHVPILLPNGQAIQHALEFDAESLEANELRERLAATPMTAELIDKLAHTHMREMYNKQVQLQELNILNTQPALANNPEKVELLARQQAIYDLNIDTRQLQNKFILSVSAIHRYLLNKNGQSHVNDIVNDYNIALGIDPHTPTQAHKKVGIFRIINDSISPFLTPQPGMQPKRNAEEPDENDLNIQYLKSKVEQHQLEQKQRAQLHSLQALIGSLRAMAAENGDYSFINAICDRVAPRIAQKNHSGMSAKR